MSIFQFLRILAARRLFLLTALFSCVTVATGMTFILPKRYKASARVLLDIVKPDPVTGQVIANQFLRAYTNTQIELIRDKQVAGLVVDQLGWETAPSVVNAYQSATAGKGHDLRQWLGDQIIDGTKADLIENSNIMEITYSAQSPDEAKKIVGLIRTTFIDSTLRTRRETAGKTADWYRDQVEKAKALLSNAEAARSLYARTNHIVLQSDNVDLENARLQALSSQSAAQTTAGSQVYVGDTAPAVNAAKTQLEQINQQLAQAAATLGPNHPNYQALLRQKTVMDAEVSRERMTAHTYIKGNAQAAFETQKSIVIAQREKVDQLNLMQRDIDVKRQQYMEASKRFGELRMEADVGEAGLSPLGDPVVPEKPYFPNKPLIIGGAIGFGAAFGIVMSLLIELTRRRVRGGEDLVYAAQVDVLSFIGESKHRNTFARRVIRYFETRIANRQANRALGPA